jgi:hypothetical protein
MMVFETAMMLSVVNPTQIVTLSGLGLGSLILLFINWNDKETFEQFFSIEGWKKLFKALLEFINGNEKIFTELCNTISQSRQTLEQQDYKKMSGCLKDSFDDLNHEMESVQAALMQLMGKRTL